MIKYYPQDRNRSNNTVGIKLPMNTVFNKSSDKLFSMSHTTEEQSVSNYINLLLTMPGERYMQPEFGIGIQRRLFEQNTTVLQIEVEDDIRTQCGRWLPYIINEEIVVHAPSNAANFSADAEHGVQISIRFRTSNNGANKTMMIFNRDGRTFYEIN